VLLIDIVEFVRLSNELGPERTVALLDDVFTRLDAASARFGVGKIKTIGDAYLASAGVPSPHPNGEEAAADFGFHALHIAEHVGRMHGVVLRLRMGMASGSVTAGVLGRTRYAYDIWGAPVNMAARLEALGDPGCILTTRDVKAVLDGKFAFEAGEVIDIKGLWRYRDMAHERGALTADPDTASSPLANATPTGLAIVSRLWRWLPCLRPLR